MKKIMKLFPVALAVLALASCSDDLMTTSTKSVDGNALYFTMESTDATRAGVVGDATASLSALNFRWTKDDQIRVYDENLAMYDVYEYGGESFAENTPAAAFTHPADWSEEKLNGYSVAVYPNDAVEAVYLDKKYRDLKHFVMNIGAEYDYEAGTGETEAYRCDVPMYGNVNDVTTGITQMNFLTAWTRIYMRNIPKDVKWICVVSEEDDEPLTGQFEAKIHYPLAADDEPWLQKKDDVEETWGNIMYSDISLAPEAFRVKGGICFPLLVQKYTNIHIYGLKSTSANTPEDLGNNMSDVDGWQKELNDGTAIEIESKTDLNITRRRQCWTVRYTYDYYLNTDAFDPFRPGEVSKVLADNADNIIGAFKVIPYSAADGLEPVDPTKAKVLTSGPGDYYTHRIEIPAISDLANIVLDFSGAGIQYDEALQIYDKNPETKQFAGKLTIIPGEIKGGSDKAKIEINLPLAEVWIVGDGVNPIGNVDVQNAKIVHIGDGETETAQDNTRTTVFKGGKLYIEDKAEVKKLYAQAYAGDPTQHATELIVNPGGYVSNYAYIQTDCNVTLNGAGYDASTQKLYTGTRQDGLASINNLDCSAVPTGITIYSQGDTRIANVIAPTAGDKLNKLTIKTKLFQKSATNAAPTKGRALGTIGADKAIVTGSMLTKLAEDGAAAVTKIYADEIDMNNVEWTGGNVGANVLSINYNTATKAMNKLDVAEQKQVSTKTGKTIIKNLKLKKITDGSGNGLFKTLNAEATIAGLELQTVEFKQDLDASANLAFGALVGVTSAAATIDEITVTGLDFESKGASMFGGLIGKATLGAVTINDASVSGTLKGRGFIGGLIGQTTNEAAAEIKIYDSKTPSLTFGLLLVDGTSLAPSQVGTFGSFIGGATMAAKISIFDCNYGTAISKEVKGAGVSTQGLRFGAIGDEATDEPFFGGNPWIGRFTGAATGTLVSVVSTAADKMTFTSFTYGPKMMELQKWAGAAAAYDMSNAAKKVANTATVHTNYIKYDGTDATVANPNEGYCYGTNLYGTYNNADFGYDNAYKDAKTAQ